MGATSRFVVSLLLASTPILIMESADVTAPAVASSRIFIKGLPPTISEEEFKKHFGVKCPITDAKLISNRRIGYVGYKTPEEAAKAVKYFNKSFHVFGFDAGCMMSK